ncbi:MAG TPA: PrsW family glutamic-type intramembrane protease [Phycisphaerae bacterium]|nr:PrsW family glutamic-type intramembrane protease [Phycisphaerae bacterium]HRW54369.1 PrsW family glutamic-type intramembrane protease [Phycisphaerae bacterium]
MQPEDLPDSRPSPVPPPTAPPIRIAGYTTEELARHSVFNELNIFPGRPNEIIQVDWRCGQCGYNLRGTMTGARCPECGSVELFRPPPPGEVSYATWYEERKRRASGAKVLIMLVGVILAGGPFAVVGAFLSNIIPTFLGPIVIGPATEEIMKICLVLLIVETRPYLVRREVEITIAAIAGALGFAVIENMLYLNMYVTNPTIGLAIWRWSICTTLHVVCSIIASRGVVAVWRATEEQKRAPTLQLMYGPLLLAIITHGAYNAIVTLMGIAGIDF